MFAAAASLLTYPIIALLQCKECEKSFSIAQFEDVEQFKYCVFCRLKHPSRYMPQLDQWQETVNKKMVTVSQGSSKSMVQIFIRGICKTVFTGWWPWPQVDKVPQIFTATVMNNCFGILWYWLWNQISGPFLFKFWVCPLHSRGKCPKLLCVRYTNQSD